MTTTPKPRLDPRRGFLHQSKAPRGPNGRILCRECGVEVPRGRLTFCSGGCVDAWKLRTDPGHVRRLVLARDHGVCAACGIDCVALAREVHGLRVNRQHNPATQEAYSVRMSELLAKGFKLSGRRSLWDADHIVPVSEGGGLCGLDGYRTLCIPCHKRVTADLRARMAAKPKIP